MTKVSFRQLATEVSTLLGESPETASIPEECPFPNIENRVRVLAPGILSEILYETAQKEDCLEVTESLYLQLLKRLAGEITG